MHYAFTLYKGLLKGHNKEVQALNYETNKLINLQRRGKRWAAGARATPTLIERGQCLPNIGAVL